MNEKTLFNRVGLSICLYIAVTIALQYALSAIVAAFWPMALYNDIMLWVLSMAPMYLVALPVCRKVLCTLPKRELYRNDMKPGMWFQMFLMTVALMYIGNIVGTIVTTILGNSTGLDFGAPIQDMMEESSLLMVFIFSVILGPIVEEFLFRKLLTDRLIVLGDRAAILITSLIFGLMHGNISQALYAFGIGLILSYVYIRTGKLRYNIGIHMLFNFCGGFIPSIFLQKIDIYHLQDNLLAGNLNAVLSQIGPLMGLAMYELAMVALGIAGFVLLIRNRRKCVLKGGEMFLTGREVAKLFVTTPGMLLWIAATVVMFAMNIFGY